MSFTRRRDDYKKATKHLLERNAQLDLEEALRQDQANARNALVQSRRGIDTMNTQETNTVAISPSGDVDPRVFETPQMQPKAPTQNVSPLDTKTKEKDTSLSNSPSTTTMEPVTMQAAGGVSTASSGVVNSETPVDMKVPRDWMIFTETRTALLPLTVYWSHVGIQNTTNAGAGYSKDGITQYCNMIRLRLNDPLNLLTSMEFRNSAVGTSDRGTHIKPVDPNNAVNVSRTFPTQLILDGSPAANAYAVAKTKPAWWNWYAKQYQHYHVIKTKYKLTFVNPKDDFSDGDTTQTDIILYYEHDVRTAADDTNTMPRTDQQLRPFMLNSWKRVQQKKMTGKRPWGADNKQSDQILEGEWEYGKWKGNTTNQEEIKTWYPTSVQGGAVAEEGGVTISPAWGEELVIVPRISELATNNFACMNVKCEILYEIQFKDLTPSYRYPDYDSPVSGSTTISTAGRNALVVPNDIRQYPILLS